MDEPDRGWMLGDVLRVERIEDRGEEEPRDEQRSDDELDVAEEHVERRDRERKAADERDEQHGERHREQLRRAHIRQGDEVHDEHSTSIAQKLTRCAATTDSGTS